MIQGAAQNQETEFYRLQKEAKIEQSEAKLEHEALNQSLLRKYEQDLEELFHRHSVLTNCNSKLEKDIKVLDMRSIEMKEEVAGLQH